MDISKHRIASLLVAAGGSLLVAGSAGATGTPPPSAPTTAESDLERAGAAALAETGDGVVTSFAVELDGFEVEVQLVDGTSVDVDLDLDFVVVRTEVDRLDDDDRPLDAEGVDLRGAVDAALVSTGGGTLVSVEVDSGGGYDVELVGADGAEYDLDLDAELVVIATERDDD